MEKLEKVQAYLKENHQDAWVIYDYECHNDAFKEMVGKIFLTRKVFVVIPQMGRPFIICHFIDTTPLKQNHVDAIYDFHIYRTWEDMKALLQKDLAAYPHILMEISEEGSLPRSSYCDYGTVSLLSNYVQQVSSSADLLMSFIAPFEGESYRLHLLAMDKIQRIKDEAFLLIESKIKNKEKISEYDVQQFILRRMDEEDLITDEPPVVAVNGNAGNPHYTPNENEYTYIQKGDLVLIDLWAKCKEENAVFADITWMGYVGKKAPEKYEKIFHIVEHAIDAGLAFLNETLAVRPVAGYEVDDVVRNYIQKAGYGDAFIHRTGHSISIDDTPHGKGVNIDGYETHDTRHLLNHVCFSMEPGIYLDDMGVREEIDVYIDNHRAVVSGRRQREIILMDIDE